MSPNLAVKAIILKNNQVLILKRSEKEDHARGVWGLPGGKVDGDENPLDALNREVWEETRLNIEIGQPVRVHFFTKDDGTKTTMITFLCKYKSGEIQLNEEHTEFEWAPLTTKKIHPAYFEDLKRTSHLLSPLP